VLFLVSAVERNIYDQRSVEYSIYENHVYVKVIRRTLQEIRVGSFLSPSKQLIVLVLVLCIVICLFIRLPDERLSVLLLCCFFLLYQTSNL